MTERGGFEALDTCVHCGFCLQACPTFLATGDEADSPRGRIDLMRALEAGELAPDDPALRLHLDRCLGCRGCEPVCPSGVGFGRGMEAARALLATRRRPSALARAALWALTSPGTSRTVYALARMLRATGIPRRLAGGGRLRREWGLRAAAGVSRAGGRAAPGWPAGGGGPRRGARVDVRVAYAPPCHLLHAQRIADEPLRVLAAIPVLRVMSLPDAAQCCGSAGLFTLLEPAMSRAVLAPKLASLRTAAPQVVATGNPGCLMQLGAGLAAGGLSAAVCHPVELLDESYRAAGYYA